MCDHDEVWTVALGADPIVEITGRAPYELAKQSADFVGWGRNANELRRVGQTEIAYDFDPKQDFVTVVYKVPARSGDVKFRTFSGDWFAASLSDDGKYLILADPYAMAVYATE